MIVERVLEAHSLGEIKRGVELGYKDCWSSFIWVACANCGKQRWVCLVKGQPRSQLCQQCAQKRKDIKQSKHWNWKGGRRKRGDGYIQVLLSPNNFFYPMATRKGLVLEHRLIMAEYLGRCLQPWEIVHHKNGITNDNQIENLEIMTGHSHSTDHNKGYRDGYQKGLNDGRLRQIQELRTENILLRLEIKALKSKMEVTNGSAN